MNGKLLCVVYLVYSIFVLRFFMGAAVFNLGLGMVAGIYIARRMYHIHAERHEFEKNVHKTAMLSSVMMGAVCCISAMMAIADLATGSDFEMMIESLTGTNITYPVFVSWIVLGACFFVLLQYILTGRTARYFFKQTGVV